MILMSQESEICCCPCVGTVGMEFYRYLIDDQLKSLKNMSTFASLIFTLIIFTI